MAIYLLLVRMPLIRRINYNRTPADALRFNAREDFCVLVIFGFLFTLGWLTTIDLKYHFIY